MCAEDLFLLPKENIHQSFQNVIIFILVKTAKQQLLFNQQLDKSMLTR